MSHSADDRDPSFGQTSRRIAQVPVTHPSFSLRVPPDHVVASESAISFVSASSTRVLADIFTFQLGTLQKNHHFTRAALASTIIYCFVF